MNAFAEYLYSIIVSPRRTAALLGEHDVPIGLGLFAIGASSLAVSLAVIMRLPMHPIAAVIALIASILLLLISAAIRTALISLVSIIGLKYRRGRSLRTFFTASLSINALLIYLLPAAFLLLLARQPAIYLIVYAAVSIAMFVCIIRVVEQHFTFRSPFAAAAAAILPAVMDALIMGAVLVLAVVLGGSMVVVH
ncbi:MAG: hypothetical protein AABZ39_08385 [Spirochaetota bacterium]